MWNLWNLKSDASCIQPNILKFKLTDEEKEVQFQLKMRQENLDSKRWAATEMKRWEHMSLFWANETHNHFTSCTPATYFLYGESWWNHQVHNKKNQAFHPYFSHVTDVKECEKY